MIGNLSASEEVARFLIKPENEYKTIYNSNNRNNSRFIYNGNGSIIIFTT